MDDGRLGDEMTLLGIAKQLEVIRTELSGVKADLSGVKADLSGVKADLSGVKAGLSEVKSELKGDIKALDGKMTIEFEETRRVVKLAFENVQMLDEKIDRRFDDTDRAHADHKSVLEAAIAGLSRGRIR